jgi:hypothetical protein
MIDTLPSSIAISPQQKEALEVIAEELRNLQDPDWQMRVAAPSILQSCMRSCVAINGLYDVPSVLSSVNKASPESSS